jgi:hypothetical protein
MLAPEPNQYWFGRREPEKAYHRHFAREARHRYKEYYDAAFPQILG